MTAAQWVVGSLGVIGSLAWLGTWVEVVLLQVFNRYYFTHGPVLLERTGGIFRGKSDSDVRMPDVNLAEFVSSQSAPATMLVRRKLTLRHFHLNVAPLWSARMELNVEENGGAAVMRLRVRHGLCWPVFVVIPALGAICALVLNASWAFLLFLLACAALGGVPIALSIRAAKRDAGHVWDAVTGASTALP